MAKLMWISFDNKTFNTKEECEAYEKQALKDKVVDFKEELNLLFDSNKIYQMCIGEIAMNYKLELDLSANKN